MAIGDWIHKQYDHVAAGVGAATTYVEKKTSAVVGQAKVAAHELYDTGKATLTSVDQTVHHVEASVGRQIEHAKQGAHQLYDRGKAGLTQVREALRDDSNTMGKLKYINPMYYTGKATEYAGKGVKLVGEGLNMGVDFLDKHSKDMPAPLRMQMGVTAGALGFAGSLVEGAGGLVDWAGRVQQGDTKTLNDTAHTVRKVGEGLAYVDGKAKEGIGSALGWVGDKTDSSLLTAAGDGYKRLGQAEQSLASPETQKSLDTVGQAGQHYFAKAGEAEGAAVAWLGDKTGIDGLKQSGQTVQKNASQMAQQTENGLTQAIDKGVADRKKEYSENGVYAVTRDLTRVTAEVASVVVAPEALAAKAGTVVKTAEITEDALRAAGTIDKTVQATEEASKLAQTAQGASTTAQGVTTTAQGATTTAQGATTTTQGVTATGGLGQGVNAAGEGSNAVLHGGEGTKVATQTAEEAPKIANTANYKELGEPIRQRYEEGANGIRERLPKLEQGVQDAERTRDELQASYDVEKARVAAKKANGEFPKGSKPQEVTDLEALHNRVKAAKEAAKKAQAEVNKANAKLDDFNSVIKVVDEMKPAPAEGFKIAENKPWWDTMQGPEAGEKQLAEHVVKHRDEMGIPADLSEADATALYLQKARDFAAHPPEGTIFIKGPNTGSTVLYNPADRTLGVYSTTEEGLVPITLHQLNPKSELFPHGFEADKTPGGAFEAFLNSK